MTSVGILCLEWHEIHIGQKRVVVGQRTRIVGSGEIYFALTGTTGEALAGGSILPRACLSSEMPG